MPLRSLNLADFSVSNLIAGILMLGFLVMNGAKGFSAFSTLRSVFKKKKNIDGRMELLEVHVDELRKQGAVKDIIISDMKTILRTMVNLVEQADVKEDGTIPSSVLTAMLDVMKPYLKDNQSEWSKFQRNID